MSEEIQTEAKVEAGRSDYGKASVRNKRKFGKEGEPAVFDPSGERGRMIDIRRAEHKKRRGVKEDVGYKSFIKQAQDARERVKKRDELNKKKDAQFVDTKKYGVKFYDKKGSGRIVKGKKIYNWCLYRLDIYKIMFSILLPIASKIISDAVNKVPENEELGEKLIEICLVILKKAVKLTKTDMDDRLLAQVEKAIKTR